MDETSPQSSDQPSGVPGQPPPVQPYELAADEPPARQPRVAPAAPKGSLDRPGLLSDFDEDADFDKDPEVEQARKSGGRAEVPVGRPVQTGNARGAAASEAGVPGAPDSNEFGQRIVTPGRGTLKTMLIVGGTLAGAAALAAGINAGAGRNPFLVGLSMVFDIALHTITGVGAVGLAAAMLGKLLRHTELAGARMLVATALFALGFQLDFQSWAHSLGILIATVLYFLSVWLLFKLKARETLVVAAFHFALWILFYLHVHVSMWAEPAAKAVQTVAPAAAGAGG